MTCIIVVKSMQPAAQYTAFGLDAVPMLKAAFSHGSLLLLRTAIPRPLNVNYWTRVAFRYLAKTAHQNL